MTARTGAQELSLTARIVQILPKSHPRNWSISGLKKRQDQVGLLLGVGAREQDPEPVGGRTLVGGNLVRENF